MLWNPSPWPAGICSAGWPQTLQVQFRKPEAPFSPRFGITTSGKQTTSYLPFLDAVLGHLSAASCFVFSGCQQHSSFPILHNHCLGEPFHLSMPDERDKGLAGSIWARASLNTSRPPYYFKRATAQTNSSSYASTTQVSQTGAFVSAPSTTPQTTIRAAATPQSYPPPGETPLHADLNSALRRVPTPWSELARYTKIVRRLRWKLPLLAYAYNAATDESNPGNEQQQEAELMFKLDFFEFYMLLERALVHLLGVFGIKVAGELGARLRNRHTGDRRGDQEGWQQSPHRFHANVLEALDDPRNPLHGALGANDVRSALARAKERKYGTAHYAARTSLMLAVQCGTAGRMRTMRTPRWPTAAAGQPGRSRSTSWAPSWK